MGYEVKLDVIFGTARTGITRAWVFTGMGINYASGPSKDFNIPGAPHLHLFNRTLSDKELNQFTEEFRIWVTGNGLRELIETFDIFLEQLYSVVLIVEAWRQKKAYDQNKQSVFNKRGTPEKIDELENFGIRTAFKDDIISVKRARSCLTHRLGVVNRRDINDSEGLKVRWRVLELYGKNEDGSEFVPDLDQLAAGPIEFPRGSAVNMRNAPRSKTFSMGSRIIFEPSEIKEICFWFLLLVDEIQKSIIKYCKNPGASVTILQPASRPSGSTPTT